MFFQDIQLKCTLFNEHKLTKDQRRKESYLRKKYKNGRDSIELLETFHLHILQADINTNMLICDSYYKMI